MIGIIDYGCGNLGSVLSMLRRIGVPARRVQRPDELVGCDRFILPGVGAFDDVVNRFRASGLEQALDRCVRVEGRALLGICVGMQMLAETSEEGVERGLGWVPGRVRHLSSILPEGARLPRMGWQYVEERAEWLGCVDLDTRYYFVHSYYFEVADPADLVLVAASEGNAPAAIRHRSIAGTQFHPEKSHRFGMNLLASFAEWEPDDADV